jgi:hypothetical protein
MPRLPANLPPVPPIAAEPTYPLTKTLLNQLVEELEEPELSVSAAPLAHKGFGSQVIERSLANGLEGTTHLDYRPDGLDEGAPRSARQIAL